MITLLQPKELPNFPSSQRGMALIELVVAIAIMGVIVGAIYQFLIFAHRETYAADAKEKVTAQVNLFFLRVSQDVRNAKSYSIISDPHQLTLDLGEDGPVVYQEGVSGSLMRAGVPMVENVTEFSFTQSGNKILIEVEVETTAGGRPLQQTFSGRVTVRNPEKGE